MKRPGPLPPPARRPQTDDPVEEAGDAEPGRERGRIASVLPFARRRSETGADGAADEPHEDPVAADGVAGPLGVWRAARRRRRAERAEVRRFTVRSRRRRIAWLSGLGALVLLVVGTVGAAYSPLFAVERITVRGASALDANAVVEALDGQLGRPFPLVDHGEIRSALIGFPAIETYAIESRPPHDLVVRIVERTPVAVIATDAGFTTVDAAGVALSTTEQQPEGLPIAEVEGGPSSEAFAAAGQVLRSLPADIAERVTAVRASSPDDVSFDLPDGGGVSVVWGSADDTAQKVDTLTAGFEAAPPDTVSTYDVSSGGVLVVG
ncbi:FtsQ-type POTRA domain-containing protein [Microbacterium karelineae]|uniref:FtsQ-type POTRA domain-containing protein n=1 Tax=Microbacterium karelineae TaxID=2654283 RepID=UPI0012EA8A0E|nr:FtsQ-type POTRA domain-containing protein [Microbacterium karelineae]